MQKISVAGENIDPIFAWLTSENANGVADAPVKWNFQKFLIDENGNLIDVISPRKEPDDEKIVKWILEKK